MVIVVKTYSVLMDILVLEDKLMVDDSKRNIDKLLSQNKSHVRLRDWVWKTQSILLTRWDRTLTDALQTESEWNLLKLFLL